MKKNNNNNKRKELKSAELPIIEDYEIVGESIDIEPRWENICRAAQAGAVKPIELMPACKIADVIRQAQKNGNKKVIFTWEDSKSELARSGCSNGTKENENDYIRTFRERQKEHSKQLQVSRT